VATENLVSVLLGKDLDETIRIVVGLCSVRTGRVDDEYSSSFRRERERERANLPRVGNHGEVSYSVLETLSLAVLLSLSNPRDLCIEKQDGLRVSQTMIRKRRETRKEKVEKNKEERGTVTHQGACTRHSGSRRTIHVRNLSG
jgi:hypothetical protein